MSTKRYRLNNHCLVGAISSTDVPPIGTVWEPQTQEEIAEAEALANVGYAEATTAAATVNTRSQNEAGTPAPRVSGEVDAIEQEDGTFQNRAGVRVHSDGSEFLEGDDDALLLLDGNVADVVGELSGDLTVEQLDRLSYLEGIGKNRKGVQDGIAAAKSAAAGE